MRLFSGLLFVTIVGALSNVRADAPQPPPMNAAPNVRHAPMMPVQRFLGPNGGAPPSPAEQVVRPKPTPPSAPPPAPVAPPPPRPQVLPAPPAAPVAAPAHRAPAPRAPRREPPASPSFVGPVSRASRQRKEPVTPGVTVHIKAFPSNVVAPVDARWLRVLSLEVTSWSDAEVLADRRLLRLEIMPKTEANSRHHVRPLVCADPDAPRASAHPSRVQSAAELGPEHRYEEWIDLREYCWGHALDLLNAGAHVKATFGFAHATRGAWVARSPGDAVSVSELDAGEFDVAPEAATHSVAVVSVAAIDRDIDDGSRGTITASVRTSGETRLVYVRPDLFSFQIRSAVGATTCGMPRDEAHPLPDFVQTVDLHRTAHVSLDMQVICKKAFPMPGIYEITPSLHLPYHLPVSGKVAFLTGDYAGRAVPLRIRGRGRAYVEQHVEDLATRAHGGPA